MATVDEANRARAQYADDLARKGAHAIGVENGEAYGRDGWVVAAYVEPQARVSLPGTLSVRHAGQTVDVPLVVREAESFAPQ